MLALRLDPGFLFAGAVQGQCRQALPDGQAAGQAAGQACSRLTQCVPFLREPSVTKPLHEAEDSVPAAAASRGRMPLWARGSRGWESRGCCVCEKLLVGGITAGGCGAPVGGFEELHVWLQCCFEEDEI